MTSEHPESSESRESDEEAMAEGYIPDSKLPEDLRPEENPLARDPDSETDDGDAADERDAARDGQRENAQPPSEPTA